MFVSNPHLTLIVTPIFALALPSFGQVFVQPIGQELGQPAGGAFEKRDVLTIVQRGPAKLVMTESYDAFAAVAKMKQEELDELVPQLILLLKSTAPVPYGELLMDAGMRQVRNQAADALAVIAGISMGQFPVRGGLLAPPNAPNQAEIDAAQDAETVKAWEDWWAESKGKTREQWLDARRKLFDQALMASKNGDATTQDAMMIYIAGIAGDTKALTSLMETIHSEKKLRAEGKSSKMKPETLSYVFQSVGRLGGKAQLDQMMEILRDEVANIGISTIPVGSVLDAIGLLGSTEQIPELIEIAKGVNAVQVPKNIPNGSDRAGHQRTAFLRSAAKALNQLTRENVVFENQIVVGNWVFASIKPEAFEAWEKAIKK